MRYVRGHRPAHAARARGAARARPGGRARSPGRRGTRRGPRPRARPPRRQAGERARHPGGRRGALLPGRLRPRPQPPTRGSAGAGAHLSGTVDYTAPEQIATEAADHRADVYSLGCVLYECLAGEPPFKRPRPAATLFAHASEPPPSLHARRPDLPEAIDQVTAKALAKEPRERYDTCRELCQAAETALGLGRPRFTRRQILLAATGAAIAIAAVAAVPTVLLGGGSAGQAPEPSVPLPLTEDSLVRIDAATSDLVEAIPLGSTVDALAVGDGSVWVVSARERVLAQIDPRTNTVVTGRSCHGRDPRGRRRRGISLGWLGCFSESSGSTTRAQPALRSAGHRASRRRHRRGRSLGTRLAKGRREDLANNRRSSLDNPGGRPRPVRLLPWVGLAAGEGSVWVVGGPERPDTVWQIDRYRQGGRRDQARLRDDRHRGGYRRCMGDEPG